MLPAGIHVLVGAWLGCVGLCVGSFINVVVWRLPQGMSIAYPGSRCPNCGSPIRGSDNVPLLAWVLLRGRCRSCRGSISARYPLVEGLAGVVTMVFFAHDGLVPLLFFHLVFAWALLALALIDLDTWLLPFRISLPLIPLGILAATVDPKATVLTAVIGAAVGWALIVMVGFVGELVLKKEAMGGGDSWLMASIGAFCGPFLLWIALFLASVQGVIYALLRGGLAPKTSVPTAPQTPADGTAGDDEDDWVPDAHAVPFGPFLALGALESILLGQKLLSMLRLPGMPMWPR